MSEVFRSEDWNNIQHIYRWNDSQTGYPKQTKKTYQKVGLKDIKGILNMSEQWELIAYGKRSADGKIIRYFIERQIGPKNIPTGVIRFYSTQWEDIPYARTWVGINVDMKAFSWISGRSKNLNADKWKYYMDCSEVI